MLNFYISNHPLEKHKKLLEVYSTCAISNLGKMADGQKVLMGGLISKIRTTVTRRKGEKMAIIRLDDLEDTVEVLVFPKTYEITSSLINDDALVFVDGRSCCFFRHKCGWFYHQRHYLGSG